MNYPDCGGICCRNVSMNPFAMRKYAKLQLIKLKYLTDILALTYQRHPLHVTIHTSIYLQHYTLINDI
jgi:hypothetical protein